MYYKHYIVKIYKKKLLFETLHSVKNCNIKNYTEKQTAMLNIYIITHWKICTVNITLIDT